MSCPSLNGSALSPVFMRIAPDMSWQAHHFSLNSSRTGCSHAFSWICARGQWYCGHVPYHLHANPMAGTSRFTVTTERKPYQWKHWGRGPKEEESCEALWVINTSFKSHGRLRLRSLHLYWQAWPIVRACSLSALLCAINMLSGLVSSLLSPWWIFRALRKKTWSTDLLCIFAMLGRNIWTMTDAASWDSYYSQIISAQMICIH